MIDKCMGGQIAEAIMFGEDQISAGCSSDLETATSVARSMIKNFGMYGQQVGYQYIEGQSYSYEEDDISELHKTKIDKEIDVILKESQQRVYNTLRNNAHELKSLAQQCYIYDTLEFDEIDAAIKGDFEKLNGSKMRESFTGTLI